MMLGRSPFGRRRIALLSHGAYMGPEAGGGVRSARDGTAARTAGGRGGRRTGGRYHNRKCGATRSRVLKACQSPLSLTRLRPRRSLLNILYYTNALSPSHTTKII
ncbi:hypothetical protein EVAR_26032_1 [Eumeta japonica]|uniref:Uncharacterized protein n=1 Tax=Eumeta variegata TaxID=151549 RepID=A0A4C1VQM1_EUMVA|nr:hypothetical protein EVAR_26032_1 [Eumeta japonica]